MSPVITGWDGVPPFGEYAISLCSSFFPDDLNLSGRLAFSIAVCNQPHRYRNSHATGLRSVTCHTVEVTCPPLPLAN